MYSEQITYMMVTNPNPNPYWSRLVNFDALAVVGMYYLDANAYSPEFSSDALPYSAVGKLRY